VANVRSSERRCPELRTAAQLRKDGAVRAGKQVQHRSEGSCAYRQTGAAPLGRPLQVAGKQVQDRSQGRCRWLASRCRIGRKAAAGGRQARAGSVRRRCGRLASRRRIGGKSAVGVSEQMRYRLQACRRVDKQVQDRSQGRCRCLASRCRIGRKAAAGAWQAGAGSVARPLQVVGKHAHRGQMVPETVARLVQVCSESYRTLRPGSSQWLGERSTGFFSGGGIASRDGGIAAARPREWLRGFLTWFSLSG
jgi:hypothetical protein